MSTQQHTVATRPLPVSKPQPTRTRVPATVQRWLARVSDEWLPQLMWSVQRTGRLGMSGIALIAACLIFLISTHLPLTQEVDGLRAQLETAQVRSDVAPAQVGDHGAALLHSLPPRTQMPALLGVLLKQADAAHLSIDTGKYETAALKSGSIVSYQISFPVSGPYPQVRQFIDGTLAALPSVALSELSLTRKSIGDQTVEAQVRLTAFTQDNR
jgi:Pilus assembly protein, PilO